MKALTSTLGLAILILVVLVISGAFFVVKETEQAIVTQFKKPVGEPITKAGLHFKIPFIQDVTKIEKRVLGWDGPSAEMPTRDKLYIIVDAFGRWQIADPLQFFLRVRDPRSASSRLDDILGSEMRNTIARHDLVELIRTTKDRTPFVDETLVGTNTPGITLPPIRVGRLKLEEEIYLAAHDKLQEFGIELLDIRFKRINYNPAVAGKIFERMMSERQQIADRFRSEGAGEAAKILGQKEKDLKEIASGAYRKVQGIEGKADAEASTIYAEAYNQTPEAREFYGFLRSLELYRTSFQNDTTMLMSTDSPLLKLLKGETSSIEKESEAAPNPSPLKRPPVEPPPPAPETQSVSPAPDLRLPLPKIE